MGNPTLTETINSKLDELKSRVNGLPLGGGFESLRIYLDDLQAGINGLVSQLDEIEGRTCK